MFLVKPQVQPQQRQSSDSSSSHYDLLVFPTLVSPRFQTWSSKMLISCRILFSPNNLSVKVMTHWWVHLGSWWHHTASASRLVAADKTVEPPAVSPCSWSEQRLFVTTLSWEDNAGEQSGSFASNAWNISYRTEETQIRCSTRRAPCFSLWGTDNKASPGSFLLFLYK